VAVAQDLIGHGAVCLDLRPDVGADRRTSRDHRGAPGNDPIVTSATAGGTEVVGHIDVESRHDRTGFAPLDLAEPWGR
jgi:hypothetical protein